MMKSKVLLFVLIALLSACSQQPSDNAVQTAIAKTEASVPQNVIEVTDTTVPTSPPTNTPTPSAADWVIEYVKITSLYVFEAGEDPSNTAVRDYATQFTQADTRVIYCELNFEHPGPDQNIAFTIRAIYKGPSGEAGEVEIDPVIQTGWTTSNWVIGFGWDDPGQWEPGFYSVDLLVGDEPFTTASFEILRDTPTPEASLTPTPRPGAVVTTNSLNIRSGPDTAFSISGSASQGDQLEIIGQAYSCAWLKIKTTSGIEGWVSSELVSYEIPCSAIPAAAIPPTPIPSTPIPQPAATPTTKAPPAGKTVSVKILNNTGGNITINLSGPATYSFNIAAGNSTIKVLPGSYTYTVWGCGTTASGTVKLKEGYEWTWYCK
jgi:hypothetical protein